MAMSIGFLDKSIISNALVKWLTSFQIPHLLSFPQHPHSYIPTLLPINLLQFYVSWKSAYGLAIETWRKEKGSSTFPPIIRIPVMLR